METYARYIMIDEREFEKFAGLKPSDIVHSPLIETH